MLIHAINYYPRQVSLYNRISFRGEKDFFEQKGYTKINTIEMKNEYGETVVGNVYICVYDDAVNIISTDDKGNHIGDLSAHKVHNKYYKFGKVPEAYICSVDNYATCHQENNLHGHSSMTKKSIEHKYTGVGKKLYEELEKYLKENCPEVKELWVYALNHGSWIFHSKIGFVGYDEYDFYDPMGIGNQMYKKI